MHKNQIIDLSNAEDAQGIYIVELAMDLKRVAPDEFKYEIQELLAKSRDILSD